MSPKPEGRIITFYSYKGGTGRSMAVANTAWILASNGKKVLVVDWDLEAPGLQRYFYPFLLDKDLAYSDGVINFVVDYKLKVMTPPPQGIELASDWYVAEANIVRYASNLKWDFAEGGRLDFVSAGRQNEHYSTLVNSFAWPEFFDVLGGAKFLDAVRQHMRQNYDYALIDSRTGVSDTSGICTIQMPDDLVVCYTLNNQSIAGAAAVALEAKRRRGESLRVFPVAMRVDSFEKKKLEFRTRFAAERFGSFPDHLDEIERSTYRALAQVPYIPYYAYEELLATFGDTIPAESLSLLKSIERLAGYLVGKDLQASHVQVVKRNRVLAEFEGSEGGGIDRLESTLEHCSSDELEIVKRVLIRLVRVASMQSDVNDTPITFRRDAFDDETQGTVSKLDEADIVVVRQGEVRLGNDWHSWQRLQQWIDDDRQFLFWRQDFYKEAFSYSKSHDKRMLLTADRLLEAESWAIRRRPDLLSIETGYIEASRRWKNIRRGGLRSIAVVLPLLLLVSIFYLSAPYRWQRVANPEIGAGKVSMTPLVKRQLKVILSSGSLGEVWDAKTAAKDFWDYAKAKVSPTGEYLLLLTDVGGAKIVTSSNCERPCQSVPLVPKPFSDVDFDASGRFILGTNSTATGLQIWRAADKKFMGEVKAADVPSLFLFPSNLYITSNGDRLIKQSLRSSVSGATSAAINEVVVSDIDHNMAYSLPLGNTLSFAINEETRQIAVVSEESGVYTVSTWDLRAVKEISKTHLLIQRNEQSQLQLQPQISIAWVGNLLLAGEILYLGSQSFVLRASDLGTETSCVRSGLLSSEGGKNWIWCTPTSSEDLLLWNGSSSTPKVLKNFESRTADNLLIRVDGSRLAVIRKTGRAELWNLETGEKIDLNTSYTDSDGNVTTENAGFVSFTLGGGSALSLRLAGGSILLFDSDKGRQVAKLDNAGGAEQEVYYDAGCGLANVWTDTGRVLKFAEKRMVFGKWFVGSGRCGK